MPLIQDGTKLVHVKAPGFIAEHIDQFVGIAYASGSEMKVAITFGRDQMSLKHEVFSQIPGHPDGFNTLVPDDAYDLSRVDFAQLSMPLATAMRLRDLLSTLIDQPLPSFVPPTSD